MADQRALRAEWDGHLGVVAATSHASSAGVLLFACLDAVEDPDALSR